MLLSGQTVNQRKNEIKGCITLNRNLIREMSTWQKNGYSDTTQESIEILSQEISGMMMELTELTRWRIGEGLGLDEPWVPKSQREYEASLSAWELESYRERVMMMEAQIIEYEENKGGK